MKITTPGGTTLETVAKMGGTYVTSTNPDNGPGCVTLTIGRITHIDGHGPVIVFTPAPAIALALGPAVLTAIADLIRQETDQ